MSAKDLPSKDDWKGLTTIARICRIRRIGDKRIKRHTT